MPPKRKAAAPLAYEAAPASAQPRPLPPGLVPARPPPPASPGSEPLLLMALDVVDEGQGRFHIWGSTPQGRSVLVRVLDFQPHFTIAAPVPTSGSRGGSNTSGPDESSHWDEGRLSQLQEALNRVIAPTDRLASIQAMRRRPILFYRPSQPEGSTFLRLCLHPGGSVKRASAAISKAMASGRLQELGLSFRDENMYEAEVNPLQRFLVDVPVSGGAWLYVAPAEGLLHVPPAPGASAAAGAGSGGGSLSAGSPGQAPRTPRLQQGAPGSPGPASPSQRQFVPSAAERRLSGCDIEVVAPWRSIHCLTPDATQLADPDWSPLAAIRPSPPPPDVAAAAAAAARGELVPLRIMVLDVLCATGDGADRVVVPERDPVVAISCSTYTYQQQAQQTQQSEHQQAGAGASPAPGEQADAGPEEDRAGDEEKGEEEELVVGAAGVAGGPSSTRGAEVAAAARLPQQHTVVFLLSKGGAAAQQQQQAWVDRSGLGPASVLVFDNEPELLLTWVQYFRQTDPDVIALFQVQDTLMALLKRFAALRLEGGGLRLCRMLPACAKPLAPRRITMYSAAWVRSQSRMSSTSNQETFRADVAGRVVVDVLRSVLTNQNLAAFSLVDCVQSLLGGTIEVLRPFQLAKLAGLAGQQQQQQHNGPGPGVKPPVTPHKKQSRGLLTTTPAPTSPASAPSAAAAATPSAGSLPSTPAEQALRLGRHARRRMEAVAALLNRLAVLPETVELARATGLTLGQIAYNAQMIRTLSLLLRVCQRLGYAVPGRQESLTLQEHTFILHPVEAGTVGLYQQPVCILDFASLYPSLFRAYNLCYSTLLHKEDMARLPSDQLEVTPTGDAFVKPSVRQGILPSILSALMSARATTRAQLKEATDPAARAVLDSRQKALKVTANALYGFTGAGASPLQCIQLADSCLALGAASCRRAKEVLEAEAAKGKLAPHGNGARVIYGHTDSLFVLLPHAPDPAAAIEAGRMAARVVSEAFPDPMELKFERACQPFLLLHVNRYAGRAFESEADVAKGGELVVKGLRSMWRQAAPIVRTTLGGALQRIIMEQDLSGAVRFVEQQVLRLLSGRVDLWELIMTGGLWRLTGEQVAEAAAAVEDEEDEGVGSGNGAGGGRGGAAAAAAAPAAAGDEVKGAHAALAVRLSERDSGRKFVLGERVPYVLLAGDKKQEDKAEDPLTAARQGRQGQADFELYWKNKLRNHVSEIFSACLPPSQLQDLLAGQHTRVKVESVSSPPPLASRLGPGSPSPAGKAKARQTGLTAFYQVTAKCLGCKRSMHAVKGSPDDAPGLCEVCISTEGKWESVYTELLGQLNEEEARQCAAHDACRQCHSGVLGQPVLCMNGECPVLYARYDSEDRARSLASSLARLDMF